MYEYMGMEAVSFDLFPFESYDHVQQPDAPEVAPTPARQEWPATDFQKRFTDDERAAIRLEARTNVRVEDLLAILTSTPIVVNIDPLTQRGMYALVALGLLTDERRIEILYG